MDRRRPSYLREVRPAPDRRPGRDQSGPRKRNEQRSYDRPSQPGLGTRGTYSKKSLQLRTYFLMLVCGVVLFAALVWQLWDIAILRHADYQQKAISQQTMDLTVTASRGNIYDRNGNTLAMSATVYTLVVSPKDLEKSVKATDYKKENGDLDPSAWAAAVAAKQEKVIQDLMTYFPDLDRERVSTQVKATKYSYREIKTNIEEEDTDPIRSYIVDNKTSSYLYLVTGTRRYYPYSGLAAQTLGFVNANGGAVGIEAQYNDVLEGTAGRVLTMRNAAGTQMYNSYSEFVDAIDGYDLTLTIDATIQSYAEKTLQRGIEAYDVQEGAFCLVMDPKTGALLAVASAPDFDLNEYSAISDEKLLQEMEDSVPEIYNKLKEKNTDGLSDSELMEKAKAQAYSDAVNAQWRNRALDSRYEPGSTFKALVVAAALEEGKVSLNDRFFCSGSKTIPGYPKPISCSKKSGHKDQDLTAAVENSCNPAFMEIGQRLGIDLFYDYLEAFGITEKTGVDLPGEASTTGAVWPRETMTGVDLAVASFGQRLEVTPLRMITAFASVINGGKLLQPYVVQSVSTKDGTVVKNTEPTVVRQVVSQETSRKVADILESVVGSKTGTGKNAYVAGYRIGGKTGSSEVKTEADHTIVSFVGFAPADDPQVIVLLAYDRPLPKVLGEHCTVTAHGDYISGGNMAAKQAGPLIGEILDYMGVEKKYNADESAAVDVSTPKVTGKTVTDAAAELGKKNLKYRTVGEGDTVTHQIPAAGAAVPGGSTVVLYLGSAVPETTGTVPGVAGLSYENARKKLEEAGFFMRASGVSVYYSNTTTAETQSVAAGTEAAIGTVITVHFVNVVEDGWVDTG